jgi:mannose-1-phosphate guanylyltransferase/phosphomannomutase
VDDNGTMLDGVATLLLAASSTASEGSGGTLAIPVTTSREVARIAGEGGMKVRWTKASPAALMEAADEGGVRLAGSPDGALIFPEFIPAPDAMTALARILSYRARTGELLSTRIEQLPRVFVAHEPVPCPWEQKGVVMREVMERAEGDRVELVDGVKVYHGEDWVLVLPDPEQPLVHVWAESDSDADAQSLAGKQVRLVRSLVE